MDTRRRRKAEGSGKETWQRNMAKIGPQLPNWFLVERIISVVNDVNCRNPGKWTLPDDAKLIKAVKKHGVVIAKLVAGRTNKFCCRRWFRHLDPDRASNKVEEEHNASDDEVLDSVPV
jgi:hypothetical protein